jgi:hypothetical protein
MPVSDIRWLLCELHELLDNPRKDRQIEHLRECPNTLGITFIPSVSSACTGRRNGRDEPVRSLIPAKSAATITSSTKPSAVLAFPSFADG